MRGPASTQVYDAAADSAQHLHPLGNSFTFDSLGVRQFPGLAAAQAALRTLTGRSEPLAQSRADLRHGRRAHVTTPFSLSYGVTNRLTIGAMVPRGADADGRVRRAESTAPQRKHWRECRSESGAARQSDGQAANADVVAQLDAASSALTNYLTSCNNRAAARTQDVTTANAALAENDLLQGGNTDVCTAPSTQTSAFAPYRQRSRQW